MLKVSRLVKKAFNQRLQEAAINFLNGFKAPAMQQAAQQGGFALQDFLEGLDDEMIVDSGSMEKVQILLSHTGDIDWEKLAADLAQG